MISLKDSTARNREDRSLGELFSDLYQELFTLIRQEVQLAKTEMSIKASKTGKDIAFLVVGGAIAYAGLLVLLAAVVIGLSNVMPAGWAALLVGLIVAGVGAFLIMSGRKRLANRELAPQRTIETIKEEKEWVKQQIK